MMWLKNPVQWGGVDSEDCYMRSAAPAMHKGPESEMTQPYIVSETLFEDAGTLTFLIRVFHRDRRGIAGGCPFIFVGQ
jgi:hypothetical protein